MGNHHHLALETPLGNLVAGMHWLQVTFATRFNRWRDERGHLFQGRYKALLVELGDALGAVCHYIHLNPVRAHIVPLAGLPRFRYSSYRYFARRRRPSFLDVTPALDAAGGLSDTAAGWHCYADFLDRQSADGPAGRSRVYVSLSRQPQPRLGTGNGGVQGPSDSRPRPCP